MFVRLGYNPLQVEGSTFTVLNESCVDSLLSLVFPPVASVDLTRDARDGHVAPYTPPEPDIYTEQLMVLRTRLQTPISPGLLFTLYL